MKIPNGDSTITAPTMSGNGGNAVFLLPEKRAVVVITTTNFNERQAHALTRTLLTRRIRDMRFATADGLIRASLVIATKGSLTCLMLRWCRPVHLNDLADGD